jgi:hypothetical protein
LKDYKLKMLSKMEDGMIVVYWKDNGVDSMILMYKKAGLEFGVPSFAEQMNITYKKALEFGVLSFVEQVEEERRKYEER